MKPSFPADSEAVFPGNGHWHHVEKATKLWSLQIKILTLHTQKRNRI